jgi:hypothetical protein
MKPGRSPVTLLTSLCAVVLAAVAAVLWFPSGSGQGADPLVGVPAAPAGWTTVFGDGFQGRAGSAPSSGTWVHDVGAGSTYTKGNVQTYTDATANTHLDGNGNLVITALKANGSWTSGRIHSTAEVAAPAGGELEVTASIEQPSPAAGLGYWDAFWLLGPGQWPGTGEVDILENVNALSDVSGTLHCGVNPGGPCDEPYGIGSGLVACPGCGTGFHTYSVLIDRRSPGAESMTWSVDGQQIFRLTEGQFPAATWQQAVDHGFSVIFDLALGGGYPDATCHCTTPTAATSSGGSLTVAYVAAYAKSP